MHCAAIVVAAGLGRRLGRRAPKAFVRLAGQPMVHCSLRAFQRHPGVREIVLVVPPAFSTKASSWRKQYPKLSAVVPGGQERSDSVRAGLRALPPACVLVLVHDAARPLISQADIGAVISASARHGAAVLASPVTDTIKLASGAKIVKTIDRTGLWRAQTPQGFHRRLLEKAYKGRALATDDSLLLEKSGIKVRLVPARHENLKVTTPTDLEIASCLLRRKRCG